MQATKHFALVSRKIGKRPMYWKNYANIRLKLTFIWASALVAMYSTQMRASAAPLILRMCACLGVWLMLNIIRTLQFGSL